MKYTSEVLKRFWIIVNITVRTLLKDKNRKVGLNIRMKSKVKDKIKK